MMMLIVIQSVGGLSRVCSLNVLFMTCEINMKITKDNFRFTYVPMFHGSNDDAVQCTVVIGCETFSRMIPVKLFNMFRYVECRVLPHEYTFTCRFIGTPPGYFYVFFSRFIRGMV